MKGLTYPILVDFFTRICWMSSFVIFGMSGLFYRFNSIFLDLVGWLFWV